MNRTPAPDASGFSYSRADFEELVDTALEHASRLGATDAGA
jgi:PmbA protein